MLLPFPVILFARFNSLGPARWLLLCPAITMLGAVVISFSRGSYLAALSFLVMASALSYRHKVCPIKKLLLLGLAIMTPLIVGALLVRQPVSATVMGFETDSQIRSFKGRRDLWKHASNMVKDYPLFGWEQITLR